jgi:hypothetical protein
MNSKTSPTNRIRTAGHLFFSAALAAFVFSFFQNCGKAGFDAMSEGDQGEVKQSLSSAPYPIEASLNQFGYMSCPMVYKNPKTPEPMSEPFFNFRVGGYDNDNLFTLKDKGHVGGIGLSSDALEHIKKTLSPTLTDKGIASFVKASPFSNGRVATVSIINQNRTDEQLSLRSVGLALTDSLSSSLMLHYLSTAKIKNETDKPPLARKVNFFSQSAGSKKNFAASISLASEADVENVRSDLRSNSLIMLGFVPAGASASPDQIIKSLEGPDGDIKKRLYGKGYILNFNNRGTNTNTHPEMTSVQELNMNPLDGKTMTPEDLTEKESQVWKCLKPLTIVRPIDRYWYSPTQNVSINFGSKTLTLAPGDPVPKPAIVMNNGIPVLATINSVSFPVQARMFQAPGEVPQVEDAIRKKYDGFQITAPWGVFAACPSVRNIADLESAESQDDLKVYRRFLPADLWDINPYYGCAVPTSKATASGHRCYVSGDVDPGKYIQYDWAIQSCGPGKAECPAFVSICYRAK